MFAHYFFGRGFRVIKYFKRNKCVYIIIIVSIVVLFIQFLIYFKRFFMFAISILLRRQLIFVTLRENF